MDEDQLLAEVMRKIIASSEEAWDGCFVMVEKYSNRLGGGLVIDGRLDGLTQEQTDLLIKLRDEAVKRAEEEWARTKS